MKQYVIKKKYMYLFIFCVKNFHLMDYHLAVFITVMLARRLVWTIISEVLLNLFLMIK